MAYKDKSQLYKYNNDFTARTYSRIQVLAPKEEGARIKTAAAAAGQSVSAYTLQAIRERMEREANNAGGGV